MAKVTGSNPVEPIFSPLPAWTFRCRELHQRITWDNDRAEMIYSDPGGFSRTLTRGPHSCLAIAGILALLVSGLAAFLVAPLARGLGEQVFEKNVVIGGGDPSFTVWSGQSVAQSFTASGTYVLLNLTLRMRNSGSTTDSINITIQPDAAGLPSGTILAGSDPVAGGSLRTLNLPLP